MTFPKQPKSAAMNGKIKRTTDINSEIKKINDSPQHVKNNSLIEDKEENYDDDNFLP